MTNLEPLAKVIQGDASNTPLEKDFTDFFSEMFKNYHLWPLTARRLAPFTAPAAFDGLTDHVTPLLGPAGRPGYKMFPGEVQNKIEATLATVKMPQIHDSYDLPDDIWARAIGGQDKEAINVNGSIEMFKQEEEIVTYQGDDKTGVKGLVSSATHDLGTPTALWGADAGADGKLENALADITAAKNYIEALVPGYPIDSVMTGPVYNLLKDTEPVNSMFKSNLEIARNILTFQDGDPQPVIWKTNVLQEPKLAVSATKNTVLFIPRIPRGAGPAWHLISSGFGMEKKKSTKPFSTEINIREKFSVKILKGVVIAWYDEVDINAS